MELDCPGSPDDLHAFVREQLGFTVARTVATTGHDAPFDYLCHSFFEDPARSPDCIVWAARGSGKTQLGAIATALDMLFKPGIQIRILGGSRDQSSRMYRHLRDLLRKPVLAEQINGRVGADAVELTNGSRVEILAQSEQAVRGQRVHKLRCDEVELFDDDIWRAAQFITRSAELGGRPVRGAVEALSTMHRPWGLMSRLVEQSVHAGRRVFRWNAMDVLERCEPERECVVCPLWRDCRGRAKQLDGHFAIDDAIRQMSRSSEESWGAEMLCERPDRKNAVYAEFDETLHVCDAMPEGELRWIGGMDFGYRSPTVLLWAALDGADVLHVLDELVATHWTVARVIREAEKRKWPRPEFIGADVAGRQRNDQTGLSAVTVWRGAGWRVRSRPHPIVSGLTAVRARLRSADGQVRLRIHPRCEELIKALRTYHYPDDDPTSDTPVKDGPDHAADALRYLIVNLDAAWAAMGSRMY